MSLCPGDAELLAGPNLLGVNTKQDVAVSCKREISTRGLIASWDRPLGDPRE